MTARWQTGTVACGGGEDIYYEVSGDDDLPRLSCPRTAPAARMPRGSSRCQHSRPMASV